MPIDPHGNFTLSHLPTSPQQFIATGFMKGALMPNDPIPRVYLSGPISGYNDYRLRFAEASVVVVELGYEPLDPTDFPDDPDRDWATWLIAYDLPLLATAQALVLLPNVHRANASLGVKVEIAFADGLHIPVVAWEDFLAYGIPTKAPAV